MKLPLPWTLKLKISLLSLLKDLREKLGLTIILITHEMEVIKEICDRVAIMEDGRIIEEGSILNIFSKPKNETTNTFWNAFQYK